MEHELHHTLAQVLAAETAMAPTFLAELDEQLRRHARSLTGVDDIANGDYTLLPRDDRFTVQFRTTTDGVVGLIEGDLVDPSTFGHPVVLGWRARGDPDQAIQPDQHRDDLEFFWIEFPVAELSAGTRVDTSAAAAAVTVPFPVEWDVHQWDGVWLLLSAHRSFTVEELDTLRAAVQRAVRDWNAREQNEIDYLAAPQIDPEQTSVRWHLDLGAAGANATSERSTRWVRRRPRARSHDAWSAGGADLRLFAARLASSVGDCGGPQDDAHRNSGRMPC